MKKIVIFFLAFVLLFTSVGISTSAASSNSPKKITISKSSKTVYVGQKYKLKVKAVTPKDADKTVVWKTSDKKIATVSSDGVVKGKKKGTVTITAVSKVNKKIKAKCKVTVKKYKTKSIDYKAKVYGYDCGYNVMGTLDSTDKYEDPHIIKTYDQLKALKKSIKKTYDVNVYYSSSRFTGDDEHLKRCNGDEILEMLDKYNKKFFKKNVLYYNCIDLMTDVDNQTIDYSYKCTKVEKKISPKGKLTCYMHIDRKFKVKTKKDNRLDTDTAVYFIELKKSDISGVKEFELLHYGYFDLKYKEISKYPISYA